MPHQGAFLDILFPNYPQFNFDSADTLHFCLHIVLYLYLCFTHKQSKVIYAQESFMPLLEISPCYGMSIPRPPRPAPVHMLNPYYDGIWRWGLWKIIREGEWSPNNGVSVPIKREVAPSPCALCHTRTHRKRVLTTSRSSQPPLL